MITPACVGAEVFPHAAPMVTVYSGAVVDKVIALLAIR